MYPKISRINQKNGFKKNCEMCNVKNSTEFFFIPAMSPNILMKICRKCALREYYGNTSAINKRYTRDKRNNNILNLKKVIKK